MPNKNEFICSHCSKTVAADFNIGTKNRNHCPKCLWSLHVDEKVAGDRKSDCKREMEPIGLTFKKSMNKYDKSGKGELMLVHCCVKCGKININRLAGDDDSDLILKIFNQSKNNAELRTSLQKQNIKLLINDCESEIKKQLFGE